MFCCETHEKRTVRCHQHGFNGCGCPGGGGGFDGMDGGIVVLRRLPNFGFGRGFDCGCPGDGRGFGNLRHDFCGCPPFGC